MHLNQETVQKLLAMEGECRGVHLILDKQFVQKRQGKQAVKKVENALEKAGCSFKYGEIRQLNFYPLGWRPLSLLAMKKALGFEDRDFRNLGSFAAKASLLVRLHLKFFYSVPAIVKRGPRIWREYFSRGNLKVTEYSEEKRFVGVEIEGLDLCPCFCRVIEGYLEAIAGMTTGAEKVECREKECSFEQGTTHRFLITWKEK